MYSIRRFGALALWVIAWPAVAAPSWSGYVATEVRGFNQSSLQEEQDHRQALSLATQPEWAWAWNGNRDQLRFVPFARVDEYDTQRSHNDIRELSYVHADNGLEWRMGVRKVFWGVTESQHLVDIINQSDLVESLDGEEKLGQPMLNMAWIKDWGSLDLYVLPLFRPRTFAGVEGRLRFNPPVAADAAQYESHAEERHVDAAVRYAHSFGDLDFGISYFNGTGRDPRLLPGLYNGQIRLIPHYDLIQQTGLDLQLTKGAWLWKWESIYRGSRAENYSAATGGFEYTLFDIAGSGMDIGLLSEMLYDDRGDKADTPFQHDVMLGVRLALNDTQSSQALLVLIEDTQKHEQVLTMEASRRLTDHVKLKLEAGVFRQVEQSAILGAFRRDDFMQFELTYYF